MAGRPLRYHWFANADMAHAHLISGVDLSTIILRLWPLAIGGDHPRVWCSRSPAGCRARAGPPAIAALFLVIPGELMPWEWFRPVNPYALIGASSPSLSFGLIPLLLAAVVLVDVVRKERIGKGWWVLVLAIALAPGSKPSVLPILLCGMGLVLLVNLLRREPVVRILAALALMLAGPRRSLAVGHAVGGRVGRQALRPAGLLPDLDRLRAARRPAGHRRPRDRRPR